MKNILLIGAGQLGSRHLQALSKVTHPSKITVIDPSNSSLTVAEQRYRETAQNPNQTIAFKLQLEDSKEVFDICIIATSASIRLLVIEDLLKKVTVKYLILEKVLFQSTDQLYKAEKLLAAHSVQTWVNCPRRMFPIYKQLKSILAGEELIHLEVEGTDWGMACNAIHFIDLWAFITDEASYQLSTEELLPLISDSKRTGYKEVFGIISGKGSNHSFSLVCNQPSQNGVCVNIRIKTENLSIEVDEIKKVAVITYANDNTEIINFDVLFQSELTNQVIDEIISNGFSELTSFDESLQLHSPFLSGMLDFFNKTSHLNLSECPIT